MQEKMKGRLITNTRANLIKRYGIKSKGKDGYKYELLKAIWVYKQKDKMFGESLAEVNIINKKLTNLMLMQVVTELNRDPIKMSEKEFNEYYEELRSKFYSEPILTWSLNEEFTGEEKKEELIRIESYASIDRKLRAEKKLKAKKDKECKKSTKEYLEKPYKIIDEKDNIKQ